MNFVKSKNRNKMMEQTLDSISKIRIYFSNSDICCCKNFIVSKKIFELFNYTIYDNIATDNSTDIDDADEVINLRSTCFFFVFCNTGVWPTYLRATIRSNY